MTSPTTSPANSYQTTALTWLPIVIGLAAMFLPTYYYLDQQLWNTEENAHGPIVLLVSLWFFWQKRQILLASTTTPNTIMGGAILIIGILTYALGRSQHILILEIGSEIIILTGVILMMRGYNALKALWFPLLFMIFLIPLPGFIVDATTGPLKYYISVLVEQILYLMGYPIARSGVVLSIGYYQLLVADACSGLNSMFSLSAMGILYLYVMQHTNRIRLFILLAAIWPVAFLANMLRVMALTLITYYFGDEVGQGFLHGLAGITLFAVGLLFLMRLDNLIGKVLPDRAMGTTQ